MQLQRSLNRRTAPITSRSCDLLWSSQITTAARWRWRSIDQTVKFHTDHHKVYRGSRIVTWIGLISIRTTARIPEVCLTFTHHRHKHLPFKSVIPGSTASQIAVSQNRRIEEVSLPCVPVRYLDQGQILWQVFVRSRWVSQIISALQRSKGGICCTASHQCKTSLVVPGPQIAVSDTTKASHRVNREGQ